MSYKALARKWRPKNLDQVVGQIHVVETLRHCLAHQRLHHAYLLSGIRGTGKTSIARILTKCLNCETGTTPTPCGTCSICTSIEQAAFTDLIEIDAASKTKVEQTREIIENAAYMPQQGRYKVYLIDEVHMLSNASFNALLKTLEEPPEHVKFILATTHPQKIPATILSRCLQFHLKRLENPQITKRINTILMDENITAEPQAIEKIALAAEGSLRDALSLIDQLIAYCNGQTITDKKTCDMLGVASEHTTKQIIGALSASNIKKLLEITTTLYKNGQNFSQLMQNTISALHTLRLSTIDQAFTPVDNQWTQLSHTLNAHQLEKLYQIAINGQAEIGLAPTPKIGMDMVFLRMLRYLNTPNTKPADTTDTPTTPALKQETVPPAPPVANTNEIKPTPQHTQPPSDASEPPLLKKWQDIIQNNPTLLKGALKLLAQNMQPKQWGEKIVLVIDQQYQAILTKKMKSLFIKAIESIVQEAQSVDIELTDQPIKTPAHVQKAAAAQKKETLEQAVKTDPTITHIVESMAGKIINIEPDQEA